MKEQENEKKPVKKKKGKLAPVLFGLLFLIGFGILAYPTISNQWNTYRQSQLISSYNNKVEEMTPEEQKISMLRSHTITCMGMCLEKTTEI